MVLMCAFCYFPAYWGSTSPRHESTRKLLQSYGQAPEVEEPFSIVTTYWTELYGIRELFYSRK
jgi:hypothetical protein